MVIPPSFMPELRQFTQSQDQAIQGAPREGGAGLGRERRLDSPALTKCAESQTNCKRAHSSPVALHRPLAPHENSSKLKFGDGSCELMRTHESARERTKAHENAREHTRTHESTRERTKAHENARKHTRTHESTRERISRTARNCKRAHFTTLNRKSPYIRKR